MLFRPSADQNLDAVHAMLGFWNGEADRFRRAAVEARAGETPTSLTIAAVEDAHDGLMSLLDELDDALSRSRPGSSQFRVLLRARATATGVLDSVSASYDILGGLAAVEVDGPTRIQHPMGVAAQ